MLKFNYYAMDKWASYIHFFIIINKKIAYENSWFQTWEMYVQFRYIIHIFIKLQYPLYIFGLIDNVLKLLSKKKKKKKK